MKLRCLLGLHQWLYSVSTDKKRAVRTCGCEDCDTTQEWNLSFRPTDLRLGYWYPCDRGNFSMIDVRNVSNSESNTPLGDVSSGQN